MTDVNEKLAAFRISERQLQSIIRHMGDGLIVVSSRGIIQIFNPAAEKMFGYAASEVIGENISLLMPEPYASRHDGFLAAYQQRNTSNVVGVVREFQALHKNGAVFPIEITITEMPAEGVLFAATIRDISERKKAEKMRGDMEKELRLSEERFQLVTAASTDGVWDWPDSTKDAVYWSPQWKAMLGYRDDEITGSKQLLETMLHPEDKTVFQDAVKRSVETGESFDVEYRLKKKSGEYSWFHGKGIVSKNAGTLRITGSITNITERKHAEEVRKKLIKELTDANEQLEQFAYVASHDLREPLRTVVSFTDLLLEDYGKLIDDAGKQYMAISRQAAKKMEAMVADLLEYGRLSHEAERFTEIDCNKKLELAKEALQEAMLSNRVIIQSEPLPKVMGNASRFSRLLQNLINNAMKYQPYGNIPRIHISADDKGTDWQFAIADNGIGIEAEYLETVFAPFKRLHSDQEYSGTGIGLAICKKIVEELGGRIWIESEMNKGSTVFFTVPKRNQAG